MSKRTFEIVTNEENAESDITSTNWDICLFCQEETNENITCPCNVKNKSHKNYGYESIVKNVNSFIDNGILDSNLTRIKQEGDNLSKLLVEKEAKYHKTCKNKYDNYHLQRILGRKREITDNPQTETETAAKCTRRSYSSENYSVLCFFCQKNDELQNLHQVTTLEIDKKIREGAKLLNNSAILAKLAEGDMVATEAKYHRKCLLKFYKDIKNINTDSSLESKQKSYAYGVALVEVINFIKNVIKNSSEFNPIFKLNNLKNKFKETYLLFAKEAVDVHSTRLKEELISAIPGLEAYKQGRDIILTTKDISAEALAEVLTNDDRNDGMCIAKAAKIIRDEMFLDEDDDPNFIPRSLTMLVQLLLEGTVRSNMENISPTSKAAFTISEIIKFNSVKRRRNVKYVRHNTQRETSVPVYLGLMVHSATRQKGLIEKLHILGLSISYKRVDQIQASVAKDICEKFQAKNMVIPESILKEKYTSAAIDNIDHNATSNTATNHFHGTSITIFQHNISKNDNINNTKSFKMDDKTKITIDQLKLPSYYTEIHPIGPCKIDNPIPVTNLPTATNLFDPVEESTSWLRSISYESVIPWAKFYSERCASIESVITSSNLLPLIDESINSPAMVAHCMGVIQKIVLHSNPHQVPVIAGDQPVYTLMKQVQWKYPNKFGMDKFVIIMGGLHIEMAFLKLLGEWLEGSEWVELLTNSGIKTPGSAAALITANHVKRTRYIHQVNIVALWMLLLKAWNESSPEISFKEWLDLKKNSCTQFLYWYNVIELESLLLMFVRSIREGNYKMYLEALEKICPWMFAMDHTNYSRWLPVFVQSLKELPLLHPYIYQQFEAGNFTVQKSSRPFSRISEDHAHEQNNKIIKETGGIIGILDCQRASHKWMVGGPAISDALKDFEDIHFGDIEYMEDDNSLDSEFLKHHENTEAHKKKFQEDTRKLYDEFIKVGNPFEEEEDHLVTLVNKNIMIEDAKNSVKECKQKGEELYKEFTKNILTIGSKSIYSTISRNNFKLFRVKNTVVTSKTKQKLSSLKKECNLYASLYIACQKRECDLYDFFSHENHAYPPAISEYGKLKPCNNKSETLSILEKLHSCEYTKPNCGGIVMEGSVLVNVVAPKSSKNFSQYCIEELLPIVSMRLSDVSVKRVDIVFDTYLKNSIKNATREKRGVGKKVKVSASTPIPKNWKTFLRVNENKTALFNLIAENIENIEIPTGKLLVATWGEVIKYKGECSENQFQSSISPCNHEEADTRVFAHVKCLVLCGHKNVMITTVDTDVVIIAISLINKLKTYGLEELWIEFGVGKNKRWLPIHAYGDKLEKPNALLFWYAFTGCDTVSSFTSIGKSTAWNVWLVFDDITAVFEKLSKMILDLEEEDLAMIERFVCLLYCRTTTEVNVNNMRRILFTNGRNVEKIPPTMNSLTEHIKRAVYQAGFVWSQSLEALQVLPDVTHWGWKEDGTPRWMTQDEASKALQILKNCKCKKNCTTSRCTCRNIGLPCTELCLCNGNCESLV